MVDTHSNSFTVPAPQALYACSRGLHSTPANGGTHACRHTLTMSHAVYDELDLSEVKFLETLFESEDSKIYKVDVHGHVCVLKVVSSSLPA